MDDINRRLVSRKEGGRGLSSIQDTIEEFIIWNIFFFLFPSYFSSLIIVLFELFLVTLIILRNLRVVISMHRCYLKCLGVLFLLLFLTQVVCLWHLCDIRPNSLLLEFWFSGPCVEVPPSSTSKNGSEYLTVVSPKLTCIMNTSSSILLA